MKYLNDGKDTCVCNTFVKEYDVMKCFHKFESLAKIRVIRMMNTYNSVHTVSIQKIEQMRQSFEDYPGEELKT